MANSPLVVYSYDYDERMKWHTHRVRVNGISFAGITEQTDADAVKRFVTLCHENATAIAGAVMAAEEKRNWNIANPGKGRNWPEFGRLERLKDDLCKQAGIKDS